LIVLAFCAQRVCRLRTSDSGLLRAKYFMCSTPRDEYRFPSVARNW
jgi:hypothetical protein